MCARACVFVRAGISIIGQIQMFDVNGHKDKHFYKKRSLITKEEVSNSLSNCY